MSCCRAAGSGLPAAVLVASLLAAAAVAAPPLRLTDDGRQKMDPRWIAGGRELVFTVQEKYNQLRLMRLNLDDDSLQPLHAGAGTSEFCISYSADQRYYAFVQNDGNLHVKLVIHDTQTGDKVEYNPGGGFAGIRTVSMAPDASRLVFAFPDADGGQQIFALGADGKNRRPLTEGTGLDAYPSFSADGRWIALASTREGNFDIFVMRADGSHANRLTEHAGLDTRPAWSPDGRRLAFTSLRDGNYDIYVIDADGTGLERVTFHEERDDFARWHPDGKRLVFVGQRDGQQDLYLLHVPE